jgi:hypothetical protein
MDAKLKRGFLTPDSEVIVNGFRPTVRDFSGFPSIPRTGEETKKEIPHNKLKN